MNKIPFEDGTKIQEAYVSIDSQNYQVTPAVWQGTVPLSSRNLNQMQTNIEKAINIQESKVTLSTTISANTDYTLPTGMYYEVGNNSLEVFYCDTKIKKRN